MRDGCVFCDYDGPVLGLKCTSDGERFYVIEPLGPVTRGHLLVIPAEHFPDFRDEDAAEVLGQAMEYAAQFAATFHPREGCNLIVSAGVEATQSVMHMHVHVVPRRAGDGLMLPWSVK